LEEFAATLEADMYSERELVELYEERYGDAPAVVAEDGPGVNVEDTRHRTCRHLT